MPLHRPEGRVCRPSGAGTVCAAWFLGLTPQAGQMRPLRGRSGDGESRSSRAEGDILDLREDVRPQVGAQALGRDELDSPAEEVFHEEGERHEVVEGLLIPLEPDEEVHVALCPLLAASERAEETERFDPQSPDLLSVLLDSPKDVLLRRDWIHGAILTTTFPRTCPDSLWSCAAAILSRG